MLLGPEGVPPRSEDMLDFLVVGGGLAGLSCAWTLRLAGHHVTVLEQNDQLRKSCQTIRSIPTMTKILDEWGIGDLVSNVAAQVDKMALVDGPTGEYIGLVAFNGKVLESLPAEHKCIPYGELYGALYDRAIQAGVQIRLNVRVASIDPWTPMVTTCDGERMSADVIVVADGFNSVIWPFFDEPKPAPGFPLRYTMNLRVPADLLRQDNEFKEIVDSGHWTVWLADDCSMHGSLAGSGPDRDYSMTMHLPRIESGQESRPRFPLSDEVLNLFEPRAQKLLKLAEFNNEILFADYEPFDNWVHESGKVVMVGEAAHPTIPCGSYNGTTSLEDAVTLSALFSIPATRSQTSMLLGIFEELRQPRCATVQAYACRKRDTVTLPHGPKQVMRDRILRQHLARDKSDGTNDEFLDFYYSGLLQVYGFDPREVIEDWWVTFGRNMLHRSPPPEWNEDARGLQPILVAAEVEQEGSPFRNVSDVLMGECGSGVVTEDEIRRRATDASSTSTLIGVES